MAEQYFTSWRTCVKLAWHVPRSTHSYVVDHLLASDISSVRSDAITRYIKFVAGLQSSPSMEVAVMFGVASKDVRTTTRRNLRLLKLETGLDSMTSNSERDRETEALAAKSKKRKLDGGEEGACWERSWFPERQPERSFSTAQREGIWRQENSSRKNCFP